MSDLERFELPAELEEFRALVRQIAEEKIAPRADEIDRTDEWPDDLYQVLVENELTGVGYPEEYGGSGGGSWRSGSWSRSSRGSRRAWRSRRPSASSG